MMGAAEFWSGGRTVWVGVEGGPSPRGAGGWLMVDAEYLPEDAASGH